MVRDMASTGTAVKGRDKFVYVAPALQDDTRTLSPRETVIKTQSELDNYRYILAEAKDQKGRISNKCLCDLQEMADQIDAKRNKISSKMHLEILHVHTAITHEKKGKPEMAMQRWRDAHKILQCDDEVSRTVKDILTLNEGMITRLAVGLHIAELSEQAEINVARKIAEKTAKSAKKAKKKVKKASRKG